MEIKLEKLKDSEIELKCSCCGKLLSVPPIYCEAAVGTICGRCSIRFEEIILTGTLQRATSYELLAKHLNFPCSNKHTGCKASLKWPDVQKHERNCASVLACPLSSNCSWRGTNLSVVKHITDCHSSLCLQYPIDVDFLFKPTNYNVTNTFCTKVLDQYFLVIWECNNNVLSCEVKCIHTHHEFEHLFYGFKMELGRNNTIAVVEQANNTINLLAGNWESNYIRIDIQDLKITLNRLCGNDRPNHTVKGTLLIFKKSVYEIAAIEKKYNVIKPLNEQQISNIISKHQTINLTQPALDLATSPTTELVRIEKFSEELECPICANYMSAPIFLCLIGHSICKHCKPLLQFCPTCRSTITNGRNFTLENLIRRLQYTCKFAEFGCHVLLTWENVEEHIRDCLYKTVKCFLNHCNDQILLLNVKDHFLQKHSQLLFKEVDILETSISTQQVSYRSIIFESLVFILRFQTEGETSPVKFDCCMFGLENAKDKYAYELQFINKTNNLKFAIKEFCKSNPTDLGNNPLVLPIQLLKSYIANTPNPTIYYKCIISKA